MAGAKILKAGGASIAYTPATVAGASAAGQAAGSLVTTLAGTISWTVMAGALAVSGSGVLTTTGTAPNSGTIAATVAADNGTDVVGKHISVPVSTYVPPAVPPGKHVLIADSTGEGVSIANGGANTSDFNYSPGARYAYWLNQQGVPARYDCASFMGDYDVLPSNITVPSSWAIESGFLHPNGSSASVVWSSRSVARAVDIYYDDVFNSVITIQLGTDTPVVLTCGTSNSVKKFTVTTATAVSGLQAKFTGGVGDIRIFAMEFYDPSVNDVRIINIGVGGAATTVWANDDQQGKRAVAQAMAGVRYYINLGINNTSGTTSAYHDDLAHITGAIAAAVPGTEIILEVPTPTNGTATAATQIAFADQLKAVARAGPYKVIMLYDHFVDWATMNANGFIYDTLHPTLSGYDNEGQFLAGQPQAFLP